jgi:hypothetical protein
MRPKRQLFPENLVLGAVITFFLAAYLTVCLRAGRFVDEDIAITHGYRLVKALTARSDETKNKAAIMDSGDSIGIPIGLSSAAAFVLFKDIAAVRVVMGLWVLFFLFSVAIFVSGVLRQTEASAELSWQEKALLLFLVLCFVQAVPNGYVNQATALGEYPGAAALLLGLGMMLRGRRVSGSVVAGLSIVCKIYYVFYLPALIVSFYLLDPKKDRLSLEGKARSLVLGAALVLSGAFGLQVFKLFVLGWHEYWGSWNLYLDLVRVQSGVAATAAKPENEFPNYSWRTQAYWVLGSYGPLAVFLALACVGRLRAKGGAVLLMLGATSACIGLAASHWMFVALLKWWRRALPFVVPGYTILVLATLLACMHASRRLRFKQWAPLVALVPLALYVQVRQAIVGVIANKPLLTHEERVNFRFYDERR